MPENFFHPETDKKLMPAIPKEERHLQRSLASSLTGQLIKCMYVVQFLVKSAGFDKESKIQMPIMIMAYNNSQLSSHKMMTNEHPGWSPYEYKNYDFWLTDEETMKNNYGKWRSKLIDEEKSFVNSK